MRITGEKSDDCNYNREGGAYICALHNAYRVLISREKLTRSINEFSVSIDWFLALKIDRENSFELGLDHIWEWI